MAAHQRSAFPSLRLQQILSGGRTVVPSLKLEAEPPPNAKEFIDRVIKCPLHDIAIPLSGFRWEYNKGNFHHWRPLFLHFETYFKTYISCRKDLLLSDDMNDEDKFPKSSVLQILRVMQIILENCHNKSSFAVLEYFKLLLASRDPEILIATLETLGALVKINPSKLHGSGKLIGCGSLNHNLLTLAQGWGSKEEGLGLSSCVVATEEAQDDGMCLFPSEEITRDGTQSRLGSTLHFEFHVPASQGRRETSDSNPATNLCVIQIPDLHLCKEDDLALLRRFVQQYNVPPEHRFSLLSRIRYAHAFHSRRTCKIYARVCILAFIVLVQSSDAHDELISFFANEPGYTNELISLVRSEGSVPGTVRSLAMLALGAQLAAYTSSHERARVLSGSSIISAGGNRMMLLTELQKAVVSLNNVTDPSHLLFVNALLQFFLLHVLSSSSSGSAIRGLGMVPPLLPLLQDSDPSHMHLVYSAVKILQKLMEYSNPAVSLFKDLGGVEILSQRLQIEVHRVIGADDESTSGMITGDSLKVDDNNIYSQKRLIKVLLKALGSATYSPANSTRSQNSENILPASLSLIFRNVKKFGGDIYFSAVTLMSEIIHKDPTCFPVLHELGLPDAFLYSVSSGILPSAKALICIPSGLGAICLNAKGLEAVKEAAALRFLVDTFSLKKYLVAMNEGVVLLANAMEELLRHVSSLRSAGVDIIIEIIEKLASLGDQNFSGPSCKLDENTAMETENEDKSQKGHDLVSSMDSNADGVSEEQFVQMCIFHVMVLVHRVTENTETCRLFVEKKGIEALMRLLLRPNIAQSSDGMPIALHSTVVFKGFTQHHSAPLANAFCTSLREHLAKALSGFNSISGSVILSPFATSDSSIFSPLFVVEFLLFLAASKDNRWISALLTEFGNGSRDVLEDVGRLHREVLWQIALLEDAKLGTDIDNSASTSEAQSSNTIVDENDERRLSSFRQYVDPLLRRRGSGWSIESQFFDLINMYRDINHSSRIPRRLDIDDPGLVSLTGPQSHSSSPSDEGTVSTADGEKRKSYYSCREMLRSLAYHIGHLFLELGNAMLPSPRRANDPVNVPASAKSVVSIFAAIILDHLNFCGHVAVSSTADVSVHTKCRYLGKVVDFIDGILLDKPESCNPIMVNCFYGSGVVQAILTTFEATSQLLSAVNRAPASPMETDADSVRQVENEETDRSWIYGPLASYGTLMDHLVTSPFIISSTTKQLLEQPLTSVNIPFPRDAETFVKVLQSKVLNAVLPVWNHPHFSDCDSDFITTIISIMRHVYSGVEVRNVNSIAGSRVAGPPPDESAISLIVEMGFSRPRAEEALRQVGTNSVEMATDWLFSHPEEPQEDDELARALAMSLGNTVTSLKEDASTNAGNIDHEELVQPPSVDELLSSCIKLMQVKESLAFPVRDLIVMVCSQDSGENRTKVLASIIDHLRHCSISDSSNSGKLAALFHVIALILHEDTASREVASRNGLVKIILDLLSEWVPASHVGENIQVPKYVTTSFLAIDRMLQVDPKVALETRVAEQLKKSDHSGQSPLVIDESKQPHLQSGALAVSSLDANDQKRLIEICCKCIQNKLPSETMHVVLQLCATLTKVHSVAVNFLDAGGLLALFSLPTSSLFPGFDNVASSIVRHILEDPQTLQQAMESEIRRSLVAAASRHSNGRVTPHSFVQNLASVIFRDPVLFMQAAKSVCQIETVGERSYVVLKKDREKEKLKEKDRTSDKDKQPATDGKGSGVDVNLVHSKSPESIIKNAKVHRKSPQSFTAVIDFLLDSVITFSPPVKVEDMIHGAACTPLADMEIDSNSVKSKGKAVVVPSDGSNAENQASLSSLAKTVFILKLLTEILLTYPSSIHVLLRRDTEVCNFHSPARESSVNFGGIFYHVLHKFLPHAGIQKKDKKTEGDWRHKLVTRANQFLVASSVRSPEGRRRIFTDINSVFNEFVNSADSSRPPTTEIHAFIDLLNDALAARLPTGSPISAEASVSFIDVGLVKSLTRTLEVLDLDNAESLKVVSGIIKALELVTKEHVHSADGNAQRGSTSMKPADETQQEHVDGTGNRFQALETMSQPDGNAAATEQIEAFNTVQASGGGDFLTDDMDHDRDLVGGFAPEGEDDFMHESSEAGGDNENTVATVEIRFDIPRNMEGNVGDEDDDEDMSGGEGEEGEDDDDDDDDDEDEEDEEHNYLEEDEVHRLSHQDTDQEDHEMDDEFDEDVLVEEEEDDEDDGEGVIFRLEDGINGINVFDHIEVFGGGNNFSNETLRVMPLEVFGSRRQGRSTSIINLLGRSGNHGIPAEHPFLMDPSSRPLVHQRQPEGTVDMAFSDRVVENASSRLDAVFRSLSPGRHGRRFSMWIDDSQQQRGSSNAPSVPQGIEEMLISQLRRPTLGQASEQNASTPHQQHKDEGADLHQPETIVREEAPTENVQNDNVTILSDSSARDSSTNVDVRQGDGGPHQVGDASNANDQVIEMQYERSEAIIRDVEAVSQGSSGSGATVGESLRSLEVEIGSADGHDDGSDRQGDLQSTGRLRRSSGSTMQMTARDASLESVSEVPSHTPEGEHDNLLGEQQMNRDGNPSAIDPTFLEALPEDLRAEVLSVQQNQPAQTSNNQPQTTGDIDPEFLAALPPDIRAEVLAQQQAQRLHQSQELEGQPVEMDTVSIIATFPSDLREEVLLTSPDAVLANLTPALVAEANMLRERFARRYHGGTLFGMYPRGWRGESSRRGEGAELDREAGAAASRGPRGTKLVEADGAPLVDIEALKAMVRLLRIVQPLYKGQFQRLLLNLCTHQDTRSSLVQLLMELLMLDVRGHMKSMDGSVESSYRLYACQSYVIYSRPQSSDGVPPLVSRRILETLTYLARNHPQVAKLFLHLELPRTSVQYSDQRHGKAVAAMQDDRSEEKGDFPIILLLSLLNQPLYLRSVAHLEQLLNLLEVVVDNAEGDSGISTQTGESLDQSSAPESVMQDVHVNADIAGSSSSVDATSTSTDVRGSLVSVILSLPQSELQLLCSLLAREGLSDSAYVLVAEILKKIVAIAPLHCNLFITELANSVQSLTVSASTELEQYEEAEKGILSSFSVDGNAILRVLQALSSLVATLNEKGKEPQLLPQKDRNDVLSQVWNINVVLEPLWRQLSNCISKIENSSESSLDLVSMPAANTFTNVSVMPPLPAGTQNILPYIESFFVTCEKLHPGQTSAANDLGTSSDLEDASTSTSGQKSYNTYMKAEEKNNAFIKFSEKHRKLLNAFIRQNPGLLERSFSLMLKVPRFIDFDNKRAHFRSKIKHHHDHHHGPLRISVRRAYILEDSYNQLRMRSPQDLKGRLTVHFQGEEGIDAGGLTREWYQLLSRVIFDKNALLFTTVGNESTFQPNPNSGYQTEHLSYFKFVGRVVGKALFDGHLLDVHFTRSFYKHILGVKVTYLDIEAVDPDYFKNLKWMLENDINDVLDLTFSMDADEEKLILYERAEVTDYELIPGGRNIRVTEENKHEYVDLVAEHRLTTAIRPQINAFMEGFNDLIPKDLISIFNDKELELLISGLPDIDLDDLRANTEYSGYNNVSPVIQWFWEVVQGFSKEDKARLLQFVTGTSKVPLEGFSALQGISGPQRFQIHKAYGSTSHLPSAHTCFNQLDMPEYTSKGQLQERLLLAIHEANEGFGFG